MLLWVDASVSPSVLFKSTLSSDGWHKLNCSPQQPTVSASDVHYLKRGSGIDGGVCAVEAVMQAQQPPTNWRQTRIEAGKRGRCSVFAAAVGQRS